MDQEGLEAVFDYGWERTAPEVYIEFSINVLELFFRFTFYCTAKIRSVNHCPDDTYYSEEPHQNMAFINDPAAPIGAYQNQPTNINFLNTHRFRVVLRRAPSLVYFVQEANLPAMGMGNATYGTPFVDIPIAGDKVKYEDFVMTFPIDEDMKNYKEIAEWLIGLGFPKQFGQYKDLAESFDGVKSDISLMILDSNHNPQHTIRFVDAFPVYISEIHFDTKATDNVIPVVSATFKYSYWEFDGVNDGTATITQADHFNLVRNPSNQKHIVP